MRWVENINESKKKKDIKEMIRNTSIDRKIKVTIFLWKILNNALGSPEMVQVVNTSWIIR